jgi:hypothetical protein
LPLLTSSRLFRRSANTLRRKSKTKAAERAQIAEDARSRVFSGRIHSYKKADLQALARALTLSEDASRWSRGATWN